MKNKKIPVTVWWAAGVFLLIALLRGVNIYVSGISSDIAYSDAYVKTVDIIHDILLLASYGFSFSLIIYCGWRKTHVKMLKTAAFFTAVIFCDRAFCILYDILSSNISFRDKNTISTALTWQGIDFLYFTAAYLSAYFITRRIRQKHSENGGKYSPGACLGFSVSVLALLKLMSQIIICARVLVEYDDLTSVDYALMTGDAVLVILKYGAGIFAFSFVGYRIIELLERKALLREKSENNEKNDDNN